MMTPNGGVFGRNPTFSNVTVENNLTVNGDLASVIVRLGTSPNGLVND